jgi:hypothetical protein
VRKSVDQEIYGLPFILPDVIRLKGTVKGFYKIIVVDGVIEVLWARLSAGPFLYASSEMNQD